jgi:O-antigen ligase
LILAFSLILSLKSWRHTVIAIASIFLLSLGATLFAEQSSIMKPLASSRQMQVLDLDKASSWIGRQKLQQVALEQIKENPITGKYAGHYYAGGPGSYSHNALSAWVNYGFIGFCAYLGLIVYCFAASFLSLKGRQANPEERNLAFAVNFLCLLLVIVAKPVFWSMPALGWGIVLNPEA